MLIEADGHADSVEAGRGDQFVGIRREALDAELTAGLGEALGVDVAKGDDLDVVAQQSRQQHLRRVDSAADPADPKGHRLNSVNAMRGLMDRSRSRDSAAP